MFTEQSVPINIETRFYSSRTKITVAIPVRFLEYYTHESTCSMVVEPIPGFDRNTLQAVVFDSNKMMNPFSDSDEYSEIVKVTVSSLNSLTIETLL